MLRKELCIAGSKVKLRKLLKDGVTTGGVRSLSHLRLMIEPGAFDEYLGVPPEAVITIIKKPKKYNNINCVQVEYENTIGFIYWCELRISADHI